ncbi:hypothetical protein PLESTB_001142500 [Pleodorina starrii]|uniref:Uncharacterized protein n=1 Tax=Pleodorina starrii TaxID=330485 RepID=A0A9W6F535_9CHLO|nr:hypothetical protein PLESTM_000562100 [Pleodorina starrii]GLC56757.1 hypothetical protein PLESTB_001142500 [Pleodorina starrii]GLC66913.1 hypothetical protein PLESTF_000489800 [Pleodorina starrii]
MDAHGPGALLPTTGNKLGGFTACRGAVATVEPASEEVSEDVSEDDGAGGRGCGLGVLHGGSGFRCEEDDCVLMAGPGCIAEQNHGTAGFHVKGGGEMEVREGCTASRNTGWGLLAEGASSVLRLGPGYGEAEALGGNAEGTCIARDGAVLING